MTIKIIEEVVVSVPNPKKDGINTFEGRVVKGKVLTCSNIHDNRGETSESVTLPVINAYEKFLSEMKEAIDSSKG